MQKVVSTGLKLDLHIHSAMSSSKDGAKVRNNTLSNIPILIDRLNDQGVNICAITDHDVFSYDMYSTLKQAEFAGGAIQKVLPGVEFSVCFSDNGKESIIHVVAIFSDEDDTKVKSIEKIIENTPPNYLNAYREEDFLALLRQIDINTILVAHQKNTLTSRKARKNDANTLGNAKFLEFVYTDYFEAFEFKNKRNEVLNKNYLIQNELEEAVRFVTGTDCHDWSVYPSETPDELIDDFPYTYAKCLPTFKGLVMAITDWRRLKQRVNSFYNVDKFTLSQIELENDGENITVPLSKGINVIIGDNSIGKSMLLHALVGFEKSGETLPRSVIEGYKSYIKRKNLKIKKQIKSDYIFGFDMQGEIRNKFEQSRLVSTEFAKYFPQAPNAQPYKTIIYNEIERLIDYLQKKFKLDSDISKLRPFSIYVNDEVPESLSFVGKLRSLKQDATNIDKVIAAIHQVNIDLEELIKLSLDEEDAVYFSKSIDRIKQIGDKYQRQKETIVLENDKIETVAKVVDDSVKRHNRSISDRQKKNSAFLDRSVSLKESIVSIVQQSMNIEPYMPTIKPVEVDIACNKIQGYSFVSKLQVSRIDNEYFMGHVKSVFKVGKRIDFSSITESKLKDALRQYDGSTPVLQFFKDALIESFNADFVPKSTITLQTSGKTEELSAGLNAKIYFDLLSYENSLDGVYIIDQPEDNVSQPSIKAYLLDCFKTMGENRQVIMVSHNPQFIVNLDVDNLIFISKSSDGKMRVQSGALEYECGEYSILKIVEDNIDGGLDSIQKRWKRYEKVNRV